MSSASNVLYLVRESRRCEWLALLQQGDAVLLIEDGVYCSAELLPKAVKIYALLSDAKARAVEPNAELIDHSKWVKLTLEFSKTVRL